MKTNNSYSDKKGTGKSKKYGSKPKKTYGRSNKGNPKDTSSTNETMAAGDINNPAYYYEDATTLGQLMNFSFNQFGGYPIEIWTDTVSRLDYSNYNVACYHLNPSVPTTTGNAGQLSGATTAAMRNFLMLSGSNAKTTNYAPQDVLILELALAEVIKMSTFCARAFGIAYMFNYRNRSYPEVLLKAMGINAVDFRANLAQYRVRFNTLMALASKIPFPNTISAFQKAADLFGSIYLDDKDSSLAQSYLFVPSTTWEFDEAYDTEGSGLKTVPVVYDATLKLMDVYLSILEAQISALLNSTTLNFIYSDILRLVQSGKISALITFTSIPEDFNVVPVYNEEVESWLHNAIILGNPLDTASQYNPFTRNYTPKNDLSSDANNNTIKYWPQFRTSVAHTGYEAFIDFSHDDVTVEEKVRATRFSQRYMNIDDGAGAYYTDEIALNDCYITRCDLYDGVSNTSFGMTTSIWEYNPNNSTYMINVMDLADRTSKFDWGPIFYLTDGMQVIRTLGDLDYYTLLDYHTIKNIYDYEVITFLQIR